MLGIGFARGLARGGGGRMCQDGTRHLHYKNPFAMGRGGGGKAIII